MARYRAVGARRSGAYAAPRALGRRHRAAARADAELPRRARRRGHRARPRRRSRPHLPVARRRAAASGFCGCWPASSMSTTPRSTAAAANLRGPRIRSQRAAAERALRDALEPPRINLLRQFNALPEGVKFLVDRRAELLDLGRHDPLLRGLEDDLRRLLGQLVRHRLSRTASGSAGNRRRRCSKS